MVIVSCSQSAQNVHLTKEIRRRFQSVCLRMQGAVVGGPSRRPKSRGPRLRPASLTASSQPCCCYPTPPDSRLPTSCVPVLVSVVFCRRIASHRARLSTHVVTTLRGWRLTGHRHLRAGGMCPIVMAASSQTQHTHSHTTRIHALIFLVTSTSDDASARGKTSRRRRALHMSIIVSISSHLSVANVARMKGGWARTY